MELFFLQLKRIYLERNFVSIVLTLSLNKLLTSTGSSKKQKSSRKNIHFSFTDYSKVFDCVDHNKLENSSRDGNTRPPDLLRNLYSGQETTVRNGHGKTDWFQIGIGVCQGCILSPCLFNLYAGYIMRNAGLDEEQAGIKIAGRNINNLR